MARPRRATGAHPDLRAKVAELVGVELDVLGQFERLSGSLPEPHASSRARLDRLVRALRTRRSVQVQGRDLAHALWELGRGDLARALEERASYTLDADGRFWPSGGRR